MIIPSENQFPQEEKATHSNFYGHERKGKEVIRGNVLVFASIRQLIIN